MKSVNEVKLLGRIGKDIETVPLANGNIVANFTIATDEGYNDKQTGQKVEKTEWHKIVAFGKTAEMLNAYAGKGLRVYISGKLQTREWEKDGIKRYVTEIVAQDFLLIDRKEQAQAEQQPYQQQQYGQQPYAQQPQPMNNQQQFAPQQQQPHPQHQQAPMQGGHYQQHPQQGGYPKMQPQHY